MKVVHRISLLLAIGLTFAGAAICEGESSGLKVGEPAPSLSAAKWIRGTPVEQYEPGHIYVIDLWSSWCKPCIEAMPGLRALEAKYSDRVSWIGLNVWEFEQSSVPAFIESHSEVMLAAVATDSIPAGKEPNEGLLASQFLGLSESTSIPKTIVVDREGQIAWIGTPELLEEALAGVLAEQ